MQACGPYRALFLFVLLGCLSVLVPGPAARAQDAQEVPDVANASGDLRLAFVAYTNYEGGPPMPAPIEFLPGEQVVFRAKVGGFRVSETEYQRYAVWVSYEMSAVDFRGLPIGKLKKGEIKESVHKEDKDWYPTLDYLFLLPSMAEYGEAELRIKVRDEFSKREKTFVQKILVKGRKLPQMDSVGVISFGFYRRQEDVSALPAGVYRPGSTLWAKFDVAGYRIEEGNRFHVECDVQVRDAEGEVLFEQPSAISREESPDYPQRYVPGVFSLEIKPGTKRAAYSIAVIAHDRLAGTTQESVHSFSVE